METNSVTEKKKRAKTSLIKLWGVSWGYVNS